MLDLDVECAKFLEDTLSPNDTFVLESPMASHDKPRQLFRTCQRPPNRVRDLFIRVDDIEVVYKLAAGVVIQDKQH